MLHSPLIPKNTSSFPAPTLYHPQPHTYSYTLALVHTHIAGEAGVPVEFAGLQFRPGHFVYADEDGIVVSESALKIPRSAAL